jgi:hypothetical protein
MIDDLAPWSSPVGDANALALRVKYKDGFGAIAEFDRIGHLILHRSSSSGPVDGIEAIVGIALLRRAVTLFAGFRALLERSLIDPAKTTARAYFELWLQYRCLAYGARHPISLEAPTTAEEREPRSRLYYVASERRGLRTRALILAPESTFKPSSAEAAEALRLEIRTELQRLRTEFEHEWKYFGELREDTLIRRVGGRDEPPWFAPTFLPKPVRTTAKLASALGYSWEYSFLYNAWSAQMHGRGIRQDVTIDGDTLAVHHPHDPTWFCTLATFVLGWHLFLLMTAAKWQSPVMIEQLQALYVRQRTAINSLNPDSDDIPQMLE